MMRKQKKNGITLIALVVTIVVLLILAGITISMLAEDNGIINNAKKAKEETIKQTATEKINLKITNSQMKSYTKEQRMPTLQEIANDLCEDDEMEYVLTESKKNATLDKIKVGENKSIFTKLKAYPYEFEINSLLQLASIDGIKIANNEKTISREEYEELLNRITELESKVKLELKEEPVVNVAKSSSGTTSFAASTTWFTNTNSYMTRQYNSEYFDYESENGFRVKKEGLYLIVMTSNISASGNAIQDIKVNNKVYCLDKEYRSSVGGHIGNQAGNMTIYLKKGDLVNGCYSTDTSGTNHFFNAQIYSFN